jgi:hypothetical protein
MSKSIYDMTDEELEVAFYAAKEELSSGVAELQNDMDEDPVEEIEEEIEYEEEEEELEQPGEDSDDNSTQNDPVVVNDDASVDPDGEIAEPVEEVVTIEEPKVQEVQKYKVKANGQEFDFELPELLQLAPKAMDYTKKMQEISPWRKTISALKDNGLTHDDVNLFIDVLKGDKNAIASVMKRTGVDALELDTDNINYQPKNYGRDDTEIAIQDVVSKFEGDADFGITADIIANKWDERSRTEFFKNPKLIESLHVDVKNGDYKFVYAEAQKLKALDDGIKSDLEYFIEAGTKYHNNKAINNFATLNAQKAQVAPVVPKVVAVAPVVDRIAEVKKQTESRNATKAAAEARKAAVPTKAKAGKTIVDYLDDSEESYDAWYNELQAKY